jgi:hypothetical protein
MVNNRVINDNAYGTHLTPLISAVLATEGDILELGMGDFSTPILHEVVKYQNQIHGLKRKILSYDSSPEWLANFTDLECGYHSFFSDDHYVKTKGCKFSVVFVDQAPAEERLPSIQHYTDCAEIIVVHDTDKMNYYKYGIAFGKFKYVKRYSRYKKSTTLLSNTIDVTKII